MENEIEIDLREIIIMLINKNKLIALVTLGITIVAIAFSQFLPNVYEAESQIVFSLSESAVTKYGTYVFPSQNVSDYLPLLDSLEVKSETKSILGLKSLDEVKSSYFFDTSGKSKYIIVKTQATTANDAKVLNNAFVSVYINRTYAQYKLIAIEKFIYQHQITIENNSFQIERTQAMLAKKSELLILLNPVYILQKAIFADPISTALYADKFNLDLSTLSNDVVLEEVLNEKYTQIDGDITDLKVTLINLEESLKTSEMLLAELTEEKSQFTKELTDLDYKNDLADGVTVLKGGISQVSQAITPINIVSPNRIQIVLIGSVLGFLLASLIVFIQYIRTKKQIISKNDTIIS